jgi:type I restriction enzyme S subunit
MKEGWEYKKLGEVCNVIGGGTPDTKNKEYWRGNIPWATVSDMNCDVIKTTGYYITARGLNESSSRIIKKGEIVIATRVGLGKVCKLAVDTAINQDLKGVIPKDNNIVRDFIFYYFKHKAKYIVDNGIGATVKGVKIKFIEGLSFGFPSLSEQQSIVDYLDSAFAKIDAMKANAEKALNEAKALFHASLKEMLEPKEGWEEKTLDDVCEIKSILVDPKEVQYKNLLHVGGANIVSETGELIDLKTAAEEELSSGKFTFNDKDVLYNKIRPYLIKVSRPGFSGLCSADMYPLTSKKGMTRDYLYYILVSRDFTDYAIMNSARAGMPKLNRQTLFAYKCMIPPLSEQQSIVETLDSLKSKVDCLQENYDKISQECDTLKQAILRQVFE